MLKFYGYGPCSTCRAALKFLRERGIPFTEIPIREQPPTIEELRAMLAAHGGQLRRLFNTSGQDYRAMGLKDRLPTMDLDEALRLLASHGNLVRRPFLIGPGIALVGFDAAAWSAALQA
jgi:arsenate reductase